MDAAPRAPRNLDATAALLAELTRDPAALVARWEGLRDAAAAQLFAAIGRGDLAAARRLRDALQAAQPFIDRNLPPLSQEADAAIALSELLHLAHLGAEALERPAAERAITRPGDTTRAVMAILRGAETALTRGEVHDRLPASVHITRARISQVLDELVRLGLATRLRVAQGERVTGHFSLSEAGQQLCRQLDVAPVASEAARIASLRGTVISRDRTYSAAEMVALMPECVPWAM